MKCFEIVIVTIFLLLLMLKASLGCDGYDLKSHYTMNCNDYESVIKITENSTIEESKCILQSSTCPITAGYKEATAQYTVWFNGITIFKGEQDLCNQHKKPMALAKVLHTVFGLQTHCPVEKITSCLKPAELNATSHKKYIKMFLGAPMKLRVEIRHENQGQSCFIAEFSLIKKK